MVLTPNLQHLSNIYFMLLKRFSLFDWLLSFNISFIPAWMRTASGVYIFKFTFRYCKNCFDVVPENNSCSTFPFFKSLLKSYILILLSMLTLYINIFFCYFLLLLHYKIIKCNKNFEEISYCPLKIYMQIYFFTGINFATKHWTIVHKLNSSNQSGDA